MSTDVNIPTTDRTKQFVDGIMNVATTIASLTPIPQDDVIVAGLRTIVDQPWFLTMLTKVVAAPPHQKAAMAANPHELLK